MEGLKTRINCSVMYQSVVFVSIWKMITLDLNLCPIVCGCLPELGTHCKKGSSSMSKYYFMSNCLYSEVFKIKEQLNSNQALLPLSITDGPLMCKEDRQESAEIEIE